MRAVSEHVVDISAATLGCQRLVWGVSNEKIRNGQRSCAECRSARCSGQFVARNSLLLDGSNPVADIAEAGPRDVQMLEHIPRRLCR